MKHCLNQKRRIIKPDTQLSSLPQFAPKVGRNTARCLSPIWLRVHPLTFQSRLRSDNTTSHWASAPFLVRRRGPRHRRIRGEAGVHFSDRRRYDTAYRLECRPRVIGGGKLDSIRPRRFADSRVIGRDACSTHLRRGYWCTSHSSTRSKQ